MRLAIMTLSSVLLIGAGDIPAISDAQLAAIAQTRYRPEKSIPPQRVLGINHGETVVADYRCSDICPAYTVRIIHYAIEPGPRCTAIGGVVVNRAVPVSIAVTMRPFCVPKAVAMVEDSRRGRSKP
jgi:hypothetical protein